MEETKADSNKTFWITFCAIMIIGAGLRMYGLTQQSLWFDETNGIRIAQLGFKEIVLGLQKDVSPPLHYFALHVWMTIFGPGELSVRSFAALFGVLLIPAICYIGSSLFNRRVGLISSFMVAISQFHIWYSQEVRMYSMLVLLGLLSMFFLHKAVTANTRSSWTAYVVFTTLTMYTHNYGLFIAASGICFFIICSLIQKADWKRFLTTQIIIAICYAPWVPTLVMRHFGSKAIVGWIPHMQTRFIFKTFQFYSGLNFALFRPLLDNAIIYIGSGIFFCFFAAGIFSLARYGRCFVPYLKKNTGLFLLLCYLFVTLAIPMIISIEKPIFLARRYSIAAWPGFILILGLGISKLRKRYLLLPAMGLIFFITSFSLYWYYFDYVKSNDRAIARFISARLNEDDLVVIAPDFLAVSMNYYLGTSFEHLGYPNPSTIEHKNTKQELFPRKPDTMVQLVEEKLAGSAGKVFLISREAKWIDGIETIAILFDKRFRKIENVRYPDTDVAVYILPKNAKTSESIPY